MDTGQYVDNTESIRDKADEKVKVFDNFLIVSRNNLSFKRCMIKFIEMYD